MFAVGTRFPGDDELRRLPSRIPRAPVGSRRRCSCRRELLRSSIRRWRWSSPGSTQWPARVDVDVRHARVPGACHGSVDLTHFGQRDVFGRVMRWGNGHGVFRPRHGVAAVCGRRGRLGVLAFRQFRERVVAGRFRRGREAFEYPAAADFDFYARQRRPAFSGHGPAERAVLRQGDVFGRGHAGEDEEFFGFSGPVVVVCRWCCGRDVFTFRQAGYRVVSAPVRGRRITGDGFFFFAHRDGHAGQRCVADCRSRSLRESPCRPRPQPGTPRLPRFHRPRSSRTCLPAFLRADIRLCPMTSFTGSSVNTGSTGPDVLKDPIRTLPVVVPEHSSPSSGYSICTATMPLISRAPLAVNSAAHGKSAECQRGRGERPT